MKKLRFLVSLTTDDNDYQVEQAKSAEQMARQLGLDIQTVYADNDAITQSTQILKAIQADESQRPDAVVFAAPLCPRSPGRPQPQVSGGRC